ncbi:Fe2+-enterobactin ABC transporter substrate-binding protein [Pseudochrobactrum kiredjianiae]|uniref:Fe2+-enterobactin ABC transporter substrate-binding protein n=1 Tax=Pseudochrobactrum kiredjianiae TaxID=386305 RepID=A0ABW3UZF6_9HYPH|nr:Fe2+-enterobactin ABC transporter substrate-binding protein [Pseudochrobactrum kiredjianiae]MDM7853132.1 Fe2+-enterobactin ABC transporter substrate-binding protein [Pseudochrobactrum kiredjianiae]
MIFAKRFFVLFAAMSALLFSVPIALAKNADWPRTIKYDAGEVTLKAKPLRIVSTTPSVTGILLAIKAPVVATAATTPSALTDDKGFFTQWAGIADERGVEILYANLDFDLESVIGWEPDLLIASATGADSVIQHYAELEAQNIPTLVVNYSNQSWQTIATQLGKATGLETEAKQAIARFNSLATEAAGKIQRPAEPVSIVGYSIGGSYSIAKPASPQAQLLTALGFEVAGLPAELEADVSRSTDFAFISHENLSAAIAGKSVFLMRGTEADVQAFLTDPVLRNLDAVSAKRVYPLGMTSFRIDYYSGLQMLETIVRQLPRL